MIALENIRRAGYSEFADARYGIYDVQFTDFHGNIVDVEIWGDRPNGHGEVHYAKKRETKEAFNAENNL